MMPRLGTRKLYWLLRERFELEGIKLGRYKFFELLRKNQLLIVKKRKYIQTTNSKHWMKKYPNTARGNRLKRPEEFLLTESFKNMELAEKTIKESVEIYNNFRPHLSCSMLTP